jgi:hypothetical protein
MGLMTLQKRYTRQTKFDKKCPCCKELVMKAWYDNYKLRVRYETPDIDLSQILMPDDLANEGNGVGLED